MIERKIEPLLRKHKVYFIIFPQTVTDSHLYYKYSADRHIQQQQQTTENP
jgi:hypothetical protein